MRKGRLLLAAALLAVTSAFLVAGTLPISAASVGAQAADASQGKVVRITAHYMKGAY